MHNKITPLKERMANGPTFGMNIYSTSGMAIEVAGNWGLDFVFIDAEHTALGVDKDMEKNLRWDDEDEPAEPGAGEEGGESEGGGKASGKSGRRR